MERQIYKKRSSDVMSPKQRHLAMSRNRGRTGPEKALCSAIWRRGLRFFTAEGYRRISRSNLIGKPDLVFPKYHTVIFLDGCFWHGCPACEKGPDPSDRFWYEKIQKNRERDIHVTASLKAENWNVIRVWEHQVRSKTALAVTADSLVQSIRENV